MIPEFPKFKKIELSDKQDVDKITSKFPPYSDFNFLSMWCWDTKGEMGISVLNNNLIVRFTDYITGKPFYSFLGDQEENETTEKLFEFIKKENSEQILKLISEEIGRNLSKSNFNKSLDPDSYDYIYPILHLSNMNNWAKHSSGKNIRSYIKLFPGYIIKHNSIQEIDKKEYLEMFKKWSENKGFKDYLNLNEYKALERIFETPQNNVNVVSMYVNNILVGFTIHEVLSNDYAISHFAKADTLYHRAIGDVLNWEEAKILNLQKIKYFNWEQDLGIPGLRKSKEKYKPSFLFKKLTVSKRLIN